MTPPVSSESTACRQFEPLRRWPSSEVKTRSSGCFPLKEAADRLEGDEMTRVLYLCTAEADRIVNREADKQLFHDLRARLTTKTSFDRHGRWIS